MESILEFYGSDDTGFVEVAGPGNFNDPDMVKITMNGIYIFFIFLIP